MEQSNMRTPNWRYQNQASTAIWGKYFNIRKIRYKKHLCTELLCYIGPCICQCNAEQYTGANYRKMLRVS